MTKDDHLIFLREIKTWIKRKMWMNENKINQLNKRQRNVKKILLKDEKKYKIGKIEWKILLELAKGRWNE